MPFSIKRNYQNCTGYAVVNTDTGAVKGCHDSQKKAGAHLAALRHNVEDAILTEIGDKFYATARAYIVHEPEELPRELASDWSSQRLNDSFLWIAGRYVQGNKANKNGHYWTYDDLQVGEASIKFTPMNVLHQWDRPVGTFVETKIVHREQAGENDLLPEIQALGVLWAANFPDVAKAAHEAHDADALWYSMECVAENMQCMTCERIFPYRAAAHEVCEHLAKRESARRFINPVFLGGALIFPPEKPAWGDADVTDVAKTLTEAITARDTATLGPAEWEHLMSLVTSN
jgi:hypothetical protein